jgi:hypothetical protein
MGLFCHTLHHALSSTLTSALWPRTSFVPGLEEIAALKQQLAKTYISLGVLELRGVLSMPGLRMNSGL